MTKYYTDYPLDGQSFTGEFKEVELLAYDRNKYVEVRDAQGLQDGIKAGYIRKYAFDNKTLKRITDQDLFKLPWEEHQPRPTRQEQAAELKAEYHHRKALYLIWAHADKEIPTIECYTLKEAVKAARKLMHRPDLVRIELVKNSKSKYAGRCDLWAVVHREASGKLGVFASQRLYKKLTSK